MREELNEVGEILLTAMLFKDIEWDVVRLYGSRYVDQWHNLSRKVIYRIKEKPYDLEIDVNGVRGKVADLLNSGAKFNIKAFGRKTNTNTLLSAVALSLLPDEQVKEAVKTFDYNTFMSVLRGEAGYSSQMVLNYTTSLFWTDVLHMIEGKVKDTHHGYLSVLYYGDPIRFLNEGVFVFHHSFNDWEKTTTFLSDAVDSPDMFHVSLESSRNYPDLRMLRAVRVDKIGEREIEKVKEILMETPDAVRKSPSILVGAYLLSKKRPEFYPLVRGYEKELKKIVKEKSLADGIEPAKNKRKIRNLL
ncbi:hypothetical protein [Desulfurobacterium sp.]|uniref:hypothetical protein n=1 Tax=Desulfurobacterium sp. TaxID=2004706 RepID=UPI002614F710|nr:hypothetical protein [Desulfurobacterium sp.]